MSEENVEIVRRFNKAVNARDLDDWLSYLDPAFEFVDHMAAVGEESGSGIEAIRLQAESWFETFPDFRMGTEEFIDAGDDRVVTVTHWQGTGAGSGLSYSQRAAEILTLRNGKIVHLEMGFADKAAALRAAGLSE
jgi:ketosteroid isomerase-like protein